MASSKLLAIALTLLVISIVVGAVFVGGGISVPYSSSSKSPSESTDAIQTSMVLQTVNLTRSITTVVPQTAFTTVTVTKTFTDYSNVTQTFNSTEVATDFSDSTNIVTTTSTSSVTTNITYTSISISTDVIIRTRR